MKKDIFLDLKLGADFFIGNVKFLGIGLAKPVLEQFIKTFFHEADSIIVDL